MYSVPTVDAAGAAFRDTGIHTPNLITLSPLRLKAKSLNEHY